MSLPSTRPWISAFRILTEKIIVYLTLRRPDIVYKCGINKYFASLDPNRFGNVKDIIFELTCK